MPEKPLPFVITDRRKVTAEGDIRPDADPSPEREPRPEPAAEAPVQTAEPEAPQAATEPETPPAAADAEPPLPPPPTPEQMDDSKRAFDATADRLDTAVRAANPGAEHPPAMSFEQIVQSVYMQAIMQLGGGTPEGQQPRIDILGARQSIDMLGILDQKTAGNLSEPEKSLLDSALFELRLAFLEITQAIARSAQQRAGSAPPPAPGAPAPGGPRIVR